MSDAFRDYKSDPTSDNLVRLLRVHQDPIYRLCFQILGRAHDAEDAAQEVLIKIVDNARGFDDPASFHRWLYRVTVNSALESSRRVARRRSHESRAAMEQPHPPLDAESRRTLFEGLAKLEDDPRSVLLDHYFAGRTLESIASRDGVSPQAVSKRLERAREELKRALPVGLLALPDLCGFFAKGAPSTVAPDLVSGPVLAKIQSVTAIATGGTIMASKTSITAVVAFSVIACLGGGAGLVFLLKPQTNSSKPLAQPTARETEARPAASTPKENRGVVEEDGDRRAVTAAKRRILEAFARHYATLSAFAPIRKDRSWAGMFLRQLIENKELKALAASIADDESGHSLTALRELYESSTSELRHFSLLLLAQGARAEFESLFVGIMKSGADDPVGSSLAAFGLGTIGSPTAMEFLAGGFRASLHDAGGKPDLTFLHALCLRPVAGLPHLVAIAEELVAMGRSTLQEFRSLGMGFPCDAGVVDQLKFLAESHTSPAIRMLALRPLVGLMRSKDDLATFEGALRREKDPTVRAEIMKMARDSAMKGDLQAMQGDARRLLAQTLVADLGGDQGSTLKVLLKLVPEDQMRLARDVLLGKAAEGVDVKKLDAILFEELPRVRSAEGRRMMQDYALKMGVEDCLSPLVVLTGNGPLTEERLIDPLIDLVQRVDAGRSRAHMTSAIIALSAFSEEFRPRILAQLESLYAGTRKPEVRTAVLEWGFARMGPAGEEVLVREASAASDPSCRIAAWSLLLRTGAIERKTDLQSGAKQFLQAWNPPASEGVAGASQVQARYYVELFASIYLKTGTVQDLPVLRSMAEKPTLTGADARLLESLGRSATAAVEMIEIRTRLN